MCKNQMLFYLIQTLTFTVAFNAIILNTHQIKLVKSVHHTHVYSTSHIIIHVIYSPLQIGQINFKDPIELVYLEAE